MQHIKKNINDLSTSGYTEVLIWSVEVSKIGDLNLDGGFPLTSSGVYIGNQTYPHFPADLATIKRSGWLWIFDQIAGTRQVRQYAQDMIAGNGAAAK